MGYAVCAGSHDRTPRWGAKREAGLCPASRRNSNRVLMTNLMTKIARRAADLLKATRSMFVWRCRPAEESATAEPVGSDGFAGEISPATFVLLIRSYEAASSIVSVSGFGSGRGTAITTLLRRQAGRPKASLSRRLERAKVLGGSVGQAVVVSLVVSNAADFPGLEWTLMDRTAGQESPADSGGVQGRKALTHERGPYLLRGDPADDPGPQGGTHGATPSRMTIAGIQNHLKELKEWPRSRTSSGASTHRLHEVATRDAVPSDQRLITIDVERV
jgi:hypothetical protein